MEEDRLVLAKTGDLSASLVVIERRYIMNSSASKRSQWLQDDFGP